ENRAGAAAETAPVLALASPARGARHKGLLSRRAGGDRHEVGDVKLAAGMPEEEGDVVQPLHVPEPQEGATIGDGPVRTLAPEDVGRRLDVREHAVEWTDGNMVHDTPPGAPAADFPRARVTSMRPATSGASPHLVRLKRAAPLRTSA